MSSSESYDVDAFKEKDDCLLARRRQKRALLDKVEEDIKEDRKREKAFDANADGLARRDVDAGGVRLLGVFQRRRAAEDGRKVHVGPVREIWGVVQPGDATASRELDV